MRALVAITAAVSSAGCASTIHAARDMGSAELLALGGLIFLTCLGVAAILRRCRDMERGFVQQANGVRRLWR